MSHTRERQVRGELDLRKEAEKREAEELDKARFFVTAAGLDSEQAEEVVSATKRRTVKKAPEEPPPAVPEGKEDKPEEAPES